MKVLTIDLKNTAKRAWMLCKRGAFRFRSLILLVLPWQRQSLGPLLETLISTL